MQPYYDDKGITIFCGDCLKVMPGLEAQSFDAIITDPPYGTTACAWDTVIPFAPMWGELRRLIRPRGAIALFGSQPFTSALVMSNPGWFRYEWVWDKRLPTGFLDAERKPLKRHENIIVFSDGRAEYRPIMRTGQLRHKGSARRSDIYGRYERTAGKYDDQYYPTSILDFSGADRTDRHPTQKPLALMEYLILTYTDSGACVLDFTMGSGTTLRAAKNLGRRAVGIELEEKYCSIAARRLQQEVMELV